jgi:hypothetical protein
MPVLLATLIGFYLGLEPVPRWLELLIAGWPLLMSYAAARQVPFNLWRAFGTLSFSRADIGPTLAFVGLGPAWALFFAMISPWLLTVPIGPIILVAAVALAIGLSRFETWSRSRKRSAP